MRETRKCVWKRISIFVLTLIIGVLPQITTKAASVDGLNYAIEATTNKSLHHYDSTNQWDEYDFVRNSPLVLEFPYADEAVVIDCLDSVTTIEIPESVIHDEKRYRIIRIDEEAFKDCSNLTSISIPISVTYIGTNAFENCNKLEDVWYVGTKSQADEIVIGDNNEYLNNAIWHYNTCITHTYSNVCDTTCNICEKMRNVTHNYGDWQVVTPATTNNKGLEKHICNRCFSEETREIPQLPSGTWKQDGTGWWYQNADGTYPASCWKEIDGVWYYFNASGYMVTGWQSIGGTWYYFAGSGAMVTGWQFIGGTWYYFAGSGAMVTGWQSIGGTWYYFAGSGAMVTGWQSIGGTWYYFAGSGAMVTGWQSIGGTWYYFAGSGAMVTGWQSIGGTWYYFEGSGAMVANRWVGNYYLQADGSMATNMWIGNYYVGADGVWVP